MLGPSVCVMCLKAEETTDHLLQGYEWAKEVWNKGGTHLGNLSLEEPPIQNLVESWLEKAFQNSILHRIYELLPSFVVWEIWKERNSHIFESKTRNPEEACTLIYAHIKETLGLRKWDTQALWVGLEATMILRNWEIFCILENVGNPGKQPKEKESLEVWDPPLKNMFKLNFDGALKGNPDPTGFEGSIRNAEGKMVGLCWGYIGENRNNVAKLKGLVVGFSMAIQQGWLPIILEGDSQVILQMVTKLLHGKPVSKVVENWKMAHTLEQVRGLLRLNSEVQTHMSREKLTN